MTVKDFGRASKEDDSYVVNVREHKTFHNYGHTQVVLTNNLHNWINVFIQEVRSQVPGIGVDENQPVFPSFNGTKMQERCRDVMAHKEDTAVRYYRLSEEAQASVKASQTLHTMMSKK